MDWSDPWVRARVSWVCVIPATLILAGSVWLVGGYSFCGTDTTEPGALGDWACESLVRPVVPWVLIVAIPLAILVFGGHVAITRKSWQLFTLSVIGAPLLLLIGLFSLTAIF